MPCSDHVPPGNDIARAGRLAVDEDHEAPLGVLVDVHLSSTVPLSGTVSWRRHDDPQTANRTAQPPGP